MKQVPSGTELARPFVPAKDFDDLDAWWTHIEGLDLPGKFNVQPPRAPAMQPWGLRIAYVFDPSGVLWHIGERREGAIQD